MSPPRPILKRSPATLPLESPSPSRRATEGVRFPPSPKLTRTHTTHSPSSYDRSPIVVTPNSCALPARGCPGKTYVLGDSTLLQKAAGKHVHPRAVAATNASHPPSNTLGLGLGLEERSTPRKTSSSSDSDPDKTPTVAASSHPSQPPEYFAMPPLIPDLSSESDESDGFCSPPPLQSSFSSSSSSSCTSTPHTLFIEIPGLPPNLSPTCLGANTSNALSFLPHPPSPPKHEHNSEESDRTPRRRDKDKIRRDRHRERSRDRDVRERLSQLEIGWDGQGVGHEDGVVEDDERDGARKYRPFSTRICGLAENDEGCLAGF